MTTTGCGRFPMGVVPPFYGLVYDPRMERFVFPGQLGLGEDGSVDGDPDALGFPLEGSPVSMRDVYIGIGYCDRDYIDRAECDERETFEPIDVTRVVFAVYLDSRSVRVLHAEKVFGRSADYVTPRLFLSSFDPTSWETVVAEELWVPPNPRDSWPDVNKDPRWVERTIARFLEDGTLVVDEWTRGIAPGRVRRHRGEQSRREWKVADHRSGVRASDRRVGSQAISGAAGRRGAGGQEPRRRLSVGG